MTDLMRAAELTGSERGQHLPEHSVQQHTAGTGISGYEKMSTNFKERVNAVKEECDRLRNLSDILSSLWEFETDLYTQDDMTFYLDVTHFDVRMFPYHKSLFPLRDYVYTFSKSFSNLVLNSDQRYPSLVFDPKRRVDSDLELKVPGYCPCSAYSVLTSLVPLHRARQNREMLNYMFDRILSPNHPWSSCFYFLDEWATEILVDEWKLDNKDVREPPRPLIDYVIFPDIVLGPENIAPDKRFDVLSRVLKHSISSIQRDHRLARAVLLLMTDYKCLNNEDNLRLLLVILSSDSQQCNSHCHSEYIEMYGLPEDDDEDPSADLPQHYCNDFQNYRLSVRHVLAYGMNYFSNVAVTTLLAFVNIQIDPFSMSKIGGPIPDDEWVDDVDGMSLIKEVIGALHSHGCLAKHKLVALIRKKYSSKSLPNNDETYDDGHISRLSCSYENCIRCLVSIGETFILRLQPSYVVAMLGGFVVKALVTVLNGEYLPLGLGAFAGTQYLGTYNTVGRSFPTLLSVTRYSDMVTSASKIPEMQLRETQDLLLCTDSQVLKEDSIIKKVFLSPISKEIVTVVRGLFLRQLVDVTTSCCGYGDFLVWSRQSISCHDKLLYDHECNFPRDDDEIESGLWGLYAEGTELRGADIAARYDFSLLALKSAWQKPWSFMSHRSFSSSFHQAMLTFSLCASRKRLPVDLFPSIFEYLQRSWFSDHRQDCWLAQCQLSHLYDDIRGVATVREFEGVCPKCRIACACSTQHAIDFMYTEGHRKICGLGPLRRYGSVEEAFCKQITSPVLNVTNESPSTEDQDSDDDSSWESIDSEEEERINLLDEKTRQIISFFSKDYKAISDEPGFRNFLRTRDGDY